MQKNDKERDEHVRSTKLPGRFREAFSIGMVCMILGLGFLAFAVHMYDALNMILPAVMRARRFFDPFAIGHQGSPARYRHRPGAMV
jgi:hypothetical protein